MASSLPNLNVVRAANAHRHQLEFMKLTWRKKKQPFLVGYHTKTIAAELDNALKRYAEGKSTYLMIKVPFRHGKSDLISRYFPCRFLGENPDDEVIVCSYGASLSYSFSKFARKIINSAEFRLMYNDVRLAKGERSVEEWGIEDHFGKAQWAGLSGALVGKGGSLLICDDFFKNREEAESERFREKRWEAFTDDFLTRAAPVSIVIVLATPWHKDDIFGRIREGMRDDPDFPYFKELKFPAASEDYPTGTLFPERFSKRWYRAQRKVLGSYAAAALLDCEPTARHGKMLRVDKIKELSPGEYPKNMVFVRAYDLASSTKERTKSDPDYTVGVKLAVRYLKVTGDMGYNLGEDLMIPVVYLDDIIRGQWEAGTRNKRIVNTAIGDGHLAIGIEAFGAYKDAYTVLKKVLLGVRGVSRVNLPGDKMAKAEVMAPILEAGNFYVRRGAPWINTLVNELRDFPSGKHDDIVDAICVGIDMTRKIIRAGRG